MWKSTNLLFFDLSTEIEEKNSKDVLRMGLEEHESLFYPYMRLLFIHLSFKKIDNLND